MKQFGALVWLCLLCLLCLISACNTQSSIQGSVKYGEGDCMPMIDDDRQRTYKPYNGAVYAFPKEWVDSSRTVNIEELIHRGGGFTPVNVKAGLLQMKLPAGTWVIMPAGFYLYNEDNTIVVREGGTVKRDFTFFRCLTY